MHTRTRIHTRTHTQTRARAHARTHYGNRPTSKITVNEYYHKLVDTQHLETGNTSQAWHSSSAFGVRRSANRYHCQAPFDFHLAKTHYVIRFPRNAKTSQKVRYNVDSGCISIINALSKRRSVAAITVLTSPVKACRLTAPLYGSLVPSASPHHKGVGSIHT